MSITFAHGRAVVIGVITAVAVGVAALAGTAAIDHGTPQILSPSTAAAPKLGGGAVLADVTAVPVCAGFTVEVPANQETMVHLDKANCTNGPITGYVSTSGPSHGGWDLGPRTNGKYDYIGDVGYLGQDAATFQATNSAGQTSQPFTVTLNVFAPGPPQCSDVTLAVPENGEIAIGLNDLQCTGTAIFAMNGPFNGVSNGSGWPVGQGWEYQPNQDFVGNDQGLFAVETTGGSVSNPFTIHFVVGNSMK